MTEPRGGAGAQRSKPRRPRVSVAGVIGELLISAGVLVLLFLGWQYWLNDLVIGGQLHDEAQTQSSTWQGNASTAEPGSEDEPPVQDKPADGERFALMIVPRWGEDYYLPIAEGTGTEAILNKGLIGHYVNTSMPGAVGNFAVAAHRMAYGHPFTGLSDLRVGDHIFIETSDGWYQYDYRNLEYVRPTGVGVIAPVPQSDGVDPQDRFLTLTSCNPRYTAAERIIAYALYDTFYPRADGPPEEIAATVGGKA
jgi:sortase A